MEKKGIPTVTIVTSAFAKPTKAALQEQGMVELSLVVVEHPIAGHNAEGIRKKGEAAFPDILKAATKWQPTAK